jgi:mono/diheme cytochrome c family protein
MSKATVLLFLFPAALVLLAIVIGVVFRARERARVAGPGTPPSRRPGPTDQALEGRLLENYQLAGVALTIFLALALPFLYIREPGRMRAAAKHQQEESVTLGRQDFVEFCARCHGQNATGGTVERYVTPGVKNAKPTDVQAPNLHEIWQRHAGQDVATVAWDTIQKGRPPTPMPTWGVRYGGPMNDQQITNLVNYLLSIQSDNKPRPQLDFKAAGAGGQRVTASGQGLRRPEVP